VRAINESVSIHLVDESIREWLSSHSAPGPVSEHFTEVE
jgi:hypothetical protein